MTWSKFSTFNWAIVSEVSAWIWIGTFWMFSTRRCAVTIISPSASELSADAPAATATEAPCRPRMEQIAQDSFWLGVTGFSMLTQAQVEKWHEDGFIVIEHFLTAEEVQLARSRFEPLFRGEFATGLAPDEWNWREGRDPEDRTRQICNGWKSDPVIAGMVLKQEIGRICATLGGWPGARIGQDNVIWKPPGAKPLGYHQDDSYIDWVVPSGYVTVWMALDDTSATGGTLEYVRGSHRWGKFPPIRQFHAPVSRSLIGPRQSAAPELAPISWRLA
jgi:hypothetical protein